MDKDALIHRLGENLLADEEVVSDDWAHVVLVVTVAPGHTRMTGFCYAADGSSTPAAPRNFDTLDLIRDLHAAMAAEAGATPWVSCLVRIARDTRRIELDFEYADPTRWEITIANRLDRARALRPA